MELYQLRTFAAVAELGHLTRAAEQLHISQPAVSAQVRALEDELGVLLFERSSSGMQLTPAGRQLLAEAGKVLEAAQAMRNAALAMRGEEQGRIRVGTVLDPAFLRIGELLTTMVDQHPLIEVDLHQEVSGTALDMVRDGRLDASFYFGDPPKPPLAAMRLRNITYRVAAPADWKARITGAGWKEIAALPWIMTPANSSHHRMVAKLFREHNLEPQRVTEADQEPVIANLVMSGVGLSLVREEVALREQQAGRIAIWDRVSLQTQMWFAYRAERAGDPVMRAVLATLASLWHVAEPEAEMAATTSPAPRQKGTRAGR